MAEYEIDNFFVRESPFDFKRGARIFVSDGGVVRVQNTEQRAITRDKISYYPIVNRAYLPGQTITTFCNLTTFTRYTVKAIDERPFVAVTDELNVPACGYQTPLPEPSVPFNPFGNPTYGVYRTFFFCDYNDKTVNVIIEKKEYVGEVLKIKDAQGTPVKIKYPETDNKFQTYRVMEFELSFIENNNFELEEFYTEDERTFRVTIVKDSQIMARGYIIPDSCREDFNDGNNVITVKCTDGIQSLKAISYPLPLGGTFNLQQSFLGIICYALAGLNLNLDIKTVCNLYATNMPNGLNDDPLDMASVNPLRLTKNNSTVLNCFEVLEEVCKAWGMFFTQKDGSWVFARQNEMSNDVLRQRTYNYTGLRLIAESITNKRLIGGVLNG